MVNLRMSVASSGATSIIILMVGAISLWDKKMCFRGSGFDQRATL